MKAKLKFLTKQSLSKKIKTKWFKGVNILLLILLIVVTNIDQIVRFFGGDFEDVTKIVVVDEMGGYDLFKTSFDTLTNDFKDTYHFEVSKTTDTLEREKASLKDDDKKIIVHLKEDKENYLSADLISFDELKTVETQFLETSINNLKSSMAILESGLSEEEISRLTRPASISLVVTNEEKSNVKNKDLITSGVILVVILPCFFLILMLVQMIGSEVNDEKTTRSMEIIISNVSPETHFLSKVLASTLFVVIQGLLLLGYGVIAIVSRFLFGGGNIINDMGTGLTSQVTSILTTVKETGILTTLLQGLPWILLLFLVSFILYGIVAGVLASMTTSMEDFQQLQTPIMLIIMVGYYLAIMASQFEGATFIKIMSYVPMLSFMLSPSLFLLGQISIYSLAMATLINIIVTFIVFKYGLRIYKVGILNYSSTKLWKKMFTSLKNKS